MQNWFCVLFLLLASAILLRAESAQQSYCYLYLELNEAEKLEKQKDYLGALARFQVAKMFLQNIRDKDPNWETALVIKRIKECDEKVAVLEPLAYQQIYFEKRQPLSSGPPLSALEQDAIACEKKGDWWGALNQYQTFLTKLEMIQRFDPAWEKETITKKKAELASAIKRVVSQIGQAFAAQPHGTVQ